MAIAKNNIKFVFELFLLLLNISDMLGCQFELVSPWYRNKVHEFLNFYGVKNAYDVPVYNMDSRGKNVDVIVKYGMYSGIWIDEHIQFHSLRITTDQDVIWYLASAAAQYAFGKKILWRFGLLSFISTIPIVVNNVLLTCLNHSLYARHCSFWSKILIGSITNICAIVGTMKIHKYLMEKKLAQYYDKWFEQVCINVFEVLYVHGYQDAALSFQEYIKKLCADRKNKAYID